MINNSMLPQTEYVITEVTSKYSKQPTVSYYTWDGFVRKLSAPIITSETLKQYSAFSKTDKDRVKDQGGFIAGRLEQKEDRRGRALCRSMITLDADFIADKKDFFVDVKKTLLFNHWFAYPTHSSTPEKPRFRLIVPLDEEVSVEEFTPLSLKIAEDIGLHYFDRSTHEASRIMFWPSIGCDGVYEAKNYDGGDFLNAKRYLERSYQDWTDASSWPDPSGRYRSKSKSKQGNPQEKPHVIGAFNRAFSVPEAIETFLGDIYSPSGSSDRYSYIPGKTYNGAVLYDDGDFLFSNHGTDPAGGKLTSAYDLVRIHKFGLLDEDAEAATPISKLPSTVKMREFCLGLPEVRRELAQPELVSAADDFAGEVESDKIADTMACLKDFSPTGIPKTTELNLSIIFRKDPKLAKSAGIDLLSGAATVTGSLPWDRGESNEYWSDFDDASLRSYLGRFYKMRGNRLIEDAKTIWLHENSHHPVREHLSSLPAWDGKNRAETMLIDFMGAEDNAYVRAVSRKWLLAAYTRAFNPGATFHNMLLLVGPQGMGKSELAIRLGGRWYGELSTMDGKEAVESILGSWIVEASEMVASKRSDLETQKSFLSRSEDKLRLAYARNVTHHRRQCVFIGTTNDEEVLKDRTGNRRFWPVDCNAAAGNNLDDLDIDQLWAEVALWYKAKEGLKLSVELQDQAQQAQKAHTEQSEYAGGVEDFLERPISKDWYKIPARQRREYVETNFNPSSKLQLRDRVSLQEIWNEGLGKTMAMKPWERAELRKILSELGWRRYAAGQGKLRFGPGYGPQVAYLRPNEETP